MAHEKAHEEDPLASRAGYKLLAAIDQFALAPFIQGARALDLGACTGGFTDCLLRFGAVHVTGVDVGPNQLRPHLRDDPRVEMIEKAHFKKMPLHIAPGPFQFFVVDVSHVAARSMLRGISKRLLPDTHGFVLLKPQFELPSSLVPRGGVVQSKNLRKLAFNRFKKKAAHYGFEILHRADSPVAGGSGTVEILLHLHFLGVPERADTPDDDD
jgi:23S rRNA (cytidine1920-2'-O)/16S rRNA (cytidine1409-2'-O)-methyltransferase